MTVAAAGAAFFWFIRIQSELQGGSEVYTEDLSEKISAKVLIAHTDYSESTRNITFYLQNVGSRAVPLDKSSNNPTTTWILLDSEQDVFCSERWNGTASECVSGCTSNLAVKETRAVVLQLTNGGACDIDTQSNNTLFYIKLDFSGIVGTGGTFEK